MKDEVGGRALYKMKNIKTVIFDKKTYIYINRSRGERINEYLFTPKELNKARERFDKYSQEE